MKVTKRRGKRREKRSGLETNLVLNPQPSVLSQVSTPLPVGVTFQTESPSLVGDVSRSDDEGEADPEEEGVDGEEGSVVEEDSSVADEGSNEADSESDGGN